VALAGRPVAVEPRTTAQAGRPAPRPAFSALTTERPIPQPPCWQDGVAAVMDELLDTR
jgi:dTDP-4-dehydrorhamnose reductase